MQAAGARQHLVDRPVVERGPQPAEPLLGGIRVRPLGSAGDRQQRLLRLDQAEVHRSREEAVEDQELGHVPPRDGPVLLAIHLQGAGAFEHGRPPHGVAPRRLRGGLRRRRPDPGRRPRARGRGFDAHRRLQKEGLHVEHAAGLVGPLREPPQAAEVPGLAVRHRGVGHAGDQLAGPLHLLEKLAGMRPAAIPPRRRLDLQMGLVDLLPHRGADHVADGAGILAGGAQAAGDRVGIGRVEGQKRDHVGLVGLAVPEPEVGLVAEGAHQGVPEPRLADRSLEREIERRLDRPGHVFGPLDLAVHPVDAVGYPREHGLVTFPCGRPRCPCCRLPARS